MITLDVKAEVDVLGFLFFISTPFSTPAQPAYPPRTSTFGLMKSSVFGPILNTKQAVR